MRSVLSMRRVRWMTLATALAIAGSAMLTGCTATSGTSTPDPRLDGEWRLASATDQDGPLGVADARVTLTIGDDAHTGGQSPCTDYTATVRGTTGVVYVTASSNGHSQCPDAVLGVLENRYLAVLNSTHFAKLSGSQLLLTSARGSLRYVRGPITEAPRLAGATWVLERVGTKRVGGAPVVIGGTISLRFSRDGNFQLTGPCATITADYSVLRSRVSVSGLQTALGDGAECTVANAQLLDGALNVLSGAFTTDIEGNRLFVTSVDAGLTASFGAATG